MEEAENDEIYLLRTKEEKKKKYKKKNPIEDR